MYVYRVSVRLASLWSVKVCAEVSLNLPRCGRRQQIARNFAAKSSARWQACYTYSINQTPTHAVSLTHTLSLSLSPPLQLACHLSIVYHRRTPQDERRYKFLVSLSVGISLWHCFRFRADLLAYLQHAACGMRHAAYLWHATNVYLNYIKQ